ncbi:nucleotidyltransferase domain-containing protein [bacterium]|nr:nucleotidyltransferase domain-containing protein [bacterium]
MGYKDVYKKVVDDVFRLCKNYYRENLVSFVVFGSVGNDEHSPGSDVDFLIVAENLPNGRGNRIEAFVENVEDAISDRLWEIYEREGFKIELSPIIKTPDEVRYGSPIFLDMTIKCWIVFDRDDFFAKYIEDLRKRLVKMGAKRIGKGKEAYWILKPEYTPGDTAEI